MRTWHEEIGAPKAEIEAWRTIDVRAMLAELCPWPVYFANDITAACAAELMFGTGGEHIDYLYVFIGSFIGGGAGAQRPPVPRPDAERRRAGLDVGARGERHAAVRRS